MACSAQLKICARRVLLLLPMLPLVVLYYPLALLATPVALAVSETRKSDGIPRLRSDAAADTAPDGQSDGSSGLLLLRRRLRRLYGAVDDPGLLERKRSVRK